MLQLKSIGVEDLLRFPYVTKPPLPSLQASIKKLTILGALHLEPKLLPAETSLFSFSVNRQRKNIDQILENSLVDSFMHASRDPTTITELGILLSKIPIDPKCGKILVVASKYDLMHYGILLVACMSVTEIFDETKIKAVNAFDEEEDQNESSGDEDLKTQIDREKQEARKMKQIA